MKKRLKEIIDMLYFVQLFPDYIAWKELADNSNPCVDWYSLPAQETLKIDMDRALIRLTMPKKSAAWKSLQQKIANELQISTISYEWGTKALARLFSGTSLLQLLKMLPLCEARKHLNQITST